MTVDPIVALQSFSSTLQEAPFLYPSLIRTRARRGTGSIRNRSTEGQRCIRFDHFQIRYGSEPERRRDTTWAR
jgi:hypothetical protein